MVNPFEGWRLIDLSEDVHPSFLNLKNEYVWGNQIRKFEAKQFIAAIDNCIMSFVSAETHVGTHVESPAHLKPDGKSGAELPLSTFIGEAVVLKFGEGALGPEHFRSVRKGDIVLLYSPGSRCHITPEGGKHLLDTGIRMLGVQGVLPDDPRAYEIGSGIEPETHKYLLGNDIPILENLTNLDKIAGERVFFVGLPLKIHRLDSSWVRAVAFDPAPPAEG